MSNRTYAQEVGYEIYTTETLGQALEQPLDLAATNMLLEGAGLQVLVEDWEDNTRWEPTEEGLRSMDTIETSRFVDETVGYAGSAIVYVRAWREDVLPYLNQCARDEPSKLTLRLLARSKVS